MANEGDILRSLTPEVIDFERGERTEDGKDVSRATISQTPISFEILRRPIFATGRGGRRAPSFIGLLDEELDFFDPLPEPEPPAPEPVLTGTSQGTQLTQDTIRGDRDPGGDPENVSGLSTVGDAELFGTPNTLGPVAPIVGTPAFRSAVEATALASRGAAAGSGGPGLGTAGGTGSISASPAGRSAETGIGGGGETGNAGASGMSADPEGQTGASASGMGPGPAGDAGGGGGGGGDCVVTTALNDMGAFTDTEKRVAVDWCRRTHHDGSRRGRAWVRGYHVWGGIVAKAARRWPLFRRFVRYTTSRFVDHATGRDHNAVGFVIHTLIVTPFSYLIGAFYKR
jgi:hypothetical protein